MLPRTLVLFSLIAVTVLGVPYTARPSEAEPIVTVDLVAGWNLFSYLGPTMPLPGALSEIEGQYTTVATLQGEEWDSFDPASPPELNDLTELIQYDAYLINMQSSAILNFDLGLGTPSPTASSTITPSPTPTSTVTTTPTATPTITPTPTCGFEAVNATMYETLSTLHLVGEVRNNNPFHARSVEISAIFYDNFGEIVATDSTFACLSIVPAFDDSPFHLVDISAPDNVDSYVVRVTGEVSPQTPPSGLEFSEIINFYDSYSASHQVLGEVANQHPNETYDSVKVCGALYNSEGDVVRSGSADVSPDLLQPGQFGSFDYVEYSTQDEPPGYRLWLDAVTID